MKRVSPKANQAPDPESADESVDNAGAATESSTDTPEPEPVVGAPEDPDPFDPAYNQLAQDYGSALGVKTAVLSLKVRKPEPVWWVRAHPDAALTMSASVIVVKGKNGVGEDYFLLPPHVQSAVDPAHITPVFLTPAINRQGNLFLWLAKLPRGGGDMNDWTATTLEGIKLAREQWVQMVAVSGHYNAKLSPPGIPDPEWPEISTSKSAMFKLAFKDFCINDAHHVVLRKLRNEI